MNLFRMLQQRAAEGKPLRVGMIGAGKFGSMYLAQARHTPGIHIAGIADLSPPRRWRAPAGTPSSTAPVRSPMRWRTAART